MDGQLVKNNNTGINAEQGPIKILQHVNFCLQSSPQMHALTSTVNYKFCKLPNKFWVAHFGRQHKTHNFTTKM